MKAARIHSYGGPEVLRIEEVPRPVPGPRDLLVEVHASSVNPVDWKIRGGGQRGIVRLKLPAILGMDLSGVVVAVGAEVKRFAPGDEVYASPTHRRDGSYAELVAVDEREVALKPRSISHEEAATLPLVGLTAYDALVTHGRVGPGQQVLILAGSGGVGTVAIQIARHLGATVSTTCSERNAELVRSLGAERVIDYHQERFEEVVEDQDVVLATLGGDAPRRSLRAVRTGGRVVCLTSDLPAYTHRYGLVLGMLAAGLDIGWLTVRARLVRGVRVVYMVRQPVGEHLAALAGWVDQGAVRPLVDRVFPLDQIAEAHRYSETGRARGKIVLTMR